MKEKYERRQKRRKKFRLTIYIPETPNPKVKFTTSQGPVKLDERKSGALNESTY